MKTIKYTKVKDMKILDHPRGGLCSNVTIDGKRKMFYGKTKAEIRQKYQSYLDNYFSSMQNQPSSNIILNDYIEYWLKNFKLKTIEPSSYDKLERVYNNQIKNTIGSMVISDVKSNDIQAMINEFASPKKSTRPLARSGLKRTLQLLNQCFNNAITEEKLAINPCDNVYIPKEVFIDVETKKQFSLSDEQLVAIKNIALKKTQNNTYKYFDGLYILVLLNTGMRAGELLALEWNDIDFTNKTIHVNKIVQDKIVDRTTDEGKRVDRIKKGSKTNAGNRFIPINETTIYYLNEIKALHSTNKISTEFVCSNGAGNRQTHRNLLRSLKTIISKDECCIPQETSLHTLRHTFGSKLIRNKVDISIVSKLMGHSNITVTYNKYIHVLQEETAKAMDMIVIA